MVLRKRNKLKEEVNYGQKVNPHGLRVGVIKDWDSRWLLRTVLSATLLVEDYKLRKFLKKALYAACVPRIEIERDATKVRIHIHCAKPGRLSEERHRNRKTSRYLRSNDQRGQRAQGSVKVFVNIVEVKQPDKNAQLVAEGVASQLERRISFRRAMKQAIGRSMRLCAKVSKSAFPASAVQNCQNRALSRGHHPSANAPG
jgi:small subunit ribosomal protein S3